MRSSCCIKAGNWAKCVGRCRPHKRNECSVGAGVGERSRVDVASILRLGCGSQRTRRMKRSQRRRHHPVYSIPHHPTASRPAAGSRRRRCLAIVVGWAAQQLSSWVHMPSPGAVAGSPMRWCSDRRSGMGSNAVLAACAATGMQRPTCMHDRTCRISLDCDHFVFMSTWIRWRAATFLRRCKAKR